MSVLSELACYQVIYTSWFVCVSTGNQYNREVRVIPVDFTDGQSVYADIQAEISDLDVAVLGEKSVHTSSVVAVT